MENLPDDYGNKLQPIDNKWKDERLEYLINLSKKDEDIPFKVVEIYEKGFKIQVAGLYGFISFYHMPWQYKNIDCWFPVFPYLVGKYFFCKIHAIVKEPLSIILNGAIPQFKNELLIQNEYYKGVVIYKDELYLLVDIGLNFDWACGSMVGIIRKSSFYYNEYDKDYQKGDEITVRYISKDENNEYLFSKDFEYIDWYSDEVENLIGKEVWTTLKRESNKYQYMVNDKFRANNYLNLDNYPHSLTKLINVLGGVTHNDMFKCKIISINKEKGFFVIRIIIPLIRIYAWDSPKIKRFFEQRVWVRVINNNNNLELIVQDTYRAVMPLLTSVEDIDNSILVNKAISSRFFDGNTIQCIVTEINIEEKYFVIRWKNIQGTRKVAINFTDYDSYLNLIPQKYKGIQNLVAD